MSFLPWAWRSPNWLANRTTVIFTKGLVLEGPPAPLDLVVAVALLGGEVLGQRFVEQ